MKYKKQDEAKAHKTKQVFFNIAKIQPFPVPIIYEEGASALAGVRFFVFEKSDLTACYNQVGGFRV